MFSFFKKEAIQSVTDLSFLACDFHSHLIPGVDDGAQTEAESLKIIEELCKLGYKKIITTPHIHGDYYRNNDSTIEPGLASLRNKIAAQQLDVTIEAAAEYYLDSYFTEKVITQPLRTFGKNYVLIEVSMLTWPMNIDQLIFEIQVNGYIPILAHPERYNIRDKEIFRELKEKNVLMQLNLMSMFHHYGPAAQKLADWMLQEHIYDFCCTDIHHSRHIDVMTKGIKGMPETIAKLKDYGFRNTELL